MLSFVVLVVVWISSCSAGQLCERRESPDCISHYYSKFVYEEMCYCMQHIHVYPARSLYIYLFL